MHKSIKALKKWGDNIITYELGIYNKLDWNAALVSFNLFSLNSVFVTVGAFSETPQGSPDNGGF